MRFYGDSPYSLGVGPVISNIFLKLFQTIIHHQILGEIRFLQYGNGMVQVGDIRSIMCIAAGNDRHTVLFAEI